MKVLFVNGCLRGEESRTLKLCETYIKNLKASKDEITVEEVVLNDTDIKPLDEEMLKERYVLLKDGKVDHPMFKFAKQLIEADHVIIGAPYWDLAFPAKVKIYLEQCCVTGLTFIYDEKGVPNGQCKADCLTYITTSGGHIGQFNFGYDYIKGLCLLLGIKDTNFISAEGLDIWGCDVDGEMEKAKKHIAEIVSKL